MKKQPYLRSFAATILCLIELLFGLAALAALFRVIFTLGTLIGTLIRAIQTDSAALVLDQLTKSVTSLSGNADASEIIKQLSETINFGIAQAIGLVVIVFVPFFLTPLLNVLNGYGIVSLRFRKKGSGLVRVVHVFYAITTLIEMVALAAGAVYTIFINKELFKELEKTAQAPNLSGILNIILIVATVILLLIMLISFCYHKDIAQNMAYISDDIEDYPRIFPENHLSGIAIFYGICSLIPLGLLAYLFMKTPDGIAGPQEIAALVIVGVYALKYFLVAAANRGLKKNVNAISTTAESL